METRPINAHLIFMCLQYSAYIYHTIDAKTLEDCALLAIQRFVRHSRTRTLEHFANGCQ